MIAGKGSWFGGPHDSSDSGHTATGGTTAEPGIAVYDRATLGGYWRVTAPNGKTAVLKQTDLGPAPWTGKKIDVTYSALGILGYNEQNFPTGTGTFRAQYLGKGASAAALAGKATSAGSPAGGGGGGGGGGLLDWLTAPLREQALRGLLYTGLVLGGAVVAGSGIYHLATSSASGREMVDATKRHASKAALAA
jgi:hypothetical protein